MLQLHSQTSAYSIFYLTFPELSAKVSYTITNLLAPKLKFFLQSSFIAFNPLPLQDGFQLITTPLQFSFVLSTLIKSIDSSIPILSTSELSANSHRISISETNQVLEQYLLSLISQFSNLCKSDFSNSK